MTFLRRIINFCIVPLIIIVIILYFYQFPHKIDVVRPAVSFYYKNPSSLKNTSVHISGTLYRPLFRQHVFKGSILIDGIESTEKSETLNTNVLERKNGINYGGLLYNNNSKKPPHDVNVLGTIWFDDDFQDISILGTNIKENQKEAVYIVTGVSYKEALSTLQKMRDKYGFGFIKFE